MEVIRIYEVYIDIFLAQNVLMNIQLLLLTQLLLKERIVPARLLMAAFAGGVGAVLILVLGIGYGIGYILLVLLLDVGMLLLCMQHSWKRKPSYQRLVMGIIYLHGMEFAYGKLTECAGRLMGERLARMVVIAVIAVIVVFILAYRKWAEVKQIYKVTLTEQGEHAVYRALFDTGNLLTDPVTGKPVSVVEETEETKKWLEKYPEKYKIIPYRSVGNEHGLLEGLVVDEMIIQKEKEQVVKKGAVIALYKGKLSKNGDFQMILNHSLIG